MAKSKTKSKTKSTKAKPAKAKKGKGKTRASKTAKAPKVTKKASSKKRVTKPATVTPVTPAVQPAPVSSSSGAIVSGTDSCVCGGASEDHGRDPEYPGSTACTHCTDCIAYEADPGAGSEAADA